MGRWNRKTREEREEKRRQREESFRQKLLKAYEPIIPFDQPIRVYKYRCIEPGSIGRPPQCWFVLDEVYHVRKSRFSENNVEIHGIIHNTNTRVTFNHKSWMSVPIENCKRSLEIIKPDVQFM